MSTHFYDALFTPLTTLSFRSFYVSWYERRLACQSKPYVTSCMRLSPHSLSYRPRFWLSKSFWGLPPSGDSPAVSPMKKAEIAAALALGDFVVHRLPEGRRNER